MADPHFVRNESRNAPRFIPPENLSISLASGMAALARGDVKDLSEVGARVLTPAALDGGKEIRIDVRSGYSLLFRAEARIVWRDVIESRQDSRVCVYGIFFTALSPFSRKLIRRLVGVAPVREASPKSSAIEEATGYTGSDFDADLEALFPSSGPRREVFDLLSDPVFERPLFEDRLEADGAEIRGNLGYFNNTDVLQMLEGARATGVLYVEGDYTGQIHLRDGRICGCFSKGLDEYEAMFRLIVADQGRFRFIPAGVRTNLPTSRTTTQLLLEAHLRLDNER